MVVGGGGQGGQGEGGVMLIGKQCEEEKEGGLGEAEGSRGGGGWGGCQGVLSTILVCVYLYDI